MNYEKGLADLIRLGKAVKTDTYSVHRVGYVHLPVAAKRRWGMSTGGHVLVEDFDTAVLVRPEMSADQEESDAARLLGRYAISYAGQMILPAEARNRWGIEKGGRVDVVDLGESVFYLKLGSLSAMLSKDGAG